MLYYLATLQTISTDVYEAAAVDGTGAWRISGGSRFRCSPPAHFFVLVVFGIGAIKLFDQAFIVSGGRAARLRDDTAVLYIYWKAFHSISSGSRPRPASSSSSSSSG